MKILSWNVAGFRACLKKGFQEFFYQEDADIFCLQEVKAEKEQYDFHPENYYEYLFPAKRKGYSGTLVFTKIKPINVIYGLGIERYDDEGRIITLEYEDFYLITMYVPNSKRDLSRLEDRMVWEEEVKTYFKKLEEKKPLIICGDFNVAATEIDIKNAKANRGNSGFTDEEREKFALLKEAGFIDTYRHFHPEKTDAYTWWSYLGNARCKNIGWRIDYFLVSKNIIEEVTNTSIYEEVMGSDHCPIGLEIKEGK